MPKAVFLEMDGVLVETAAADLAAFNTAFALLEVPTRWDEALYLRIAGTQGARARLSAYFERYGWPLTRQGNEKLLTELAEAHDVALLSAARSGNLVLKVGAAPLIDQFHAAGAVLGIVTEMPEAVVATCLSQLGLSGATKVAFMVCDGTAASSKPAPDPYKAALIQAAVLAAEAIAIEGSQGGIRAAKAAGLRVLGVGNELFPADRLAAADGVIADLDTVEAAKALSVMVSS